MEMTLAICIYRVLYNGISCLQRHALPLVSVTITGGSYYGFYEFKVRTVRLE